MQSGFELGRADSAIGPSPKASGQVEKNVQDARRRLWQAMQRFATLFELNEWLEQQCQALWRESPHGSQEGSIFDTWQSEVQSLMPPSSPFNGFVECGRRVSPTCLVHSDRNRYSVPASFANHRVSLRVYPDRLVVVAERQVICEHARLIERSHHVPGRTIYDWRHHLAVIQRKPGALRNGAPFTDFPEAFRQLMQTMMLPDSVASARHSTIQSRKLASWFDPGGR